MRQHGFVLDLDRCTGCAACVVACTNENNPGRPLDWRRIFTSNRRLLATAAVFHYSLACNHCLDPACLEGCPAAAFTKDRATGAVVLDRNRCIGCRYCVWVCPYDAPRFNTGEGTVAKCTFCDHRLNNGLEPACVAACPLEALALETVADPAPIARAGFPETGLRPAIRIVGSRRQTPPQMTVAIPTGPTTRRPRPLRWSALHEEGSLWIFTSAMALLVAWFAAATTTGGEVALPVFSAAGVLALGVSVLHLGRPARAWRGLLNWRSSWISREAVLVVLFLTAAGATTLGGTAGAGARWAVAGLGFAALFAMDMVYRVPGQSVPAVPHSAMTTVTAAYYVGLLFAAPALAVPVAALKLVLYLLRRRRFAPGGVILAAVRAAALVLPCALLAATAPSPWLLVGLAAVGELVDRAEFYAGLEFLTPQLQIERDLHPPQRSIV